MRASWSPANFTVSASAAELSSQTSENAVVHVRPALSRVWEMGHSQAQSLWAWPSRSTAAIE
jgi:hypothetical protein